MIVFDVINDEAPLFIEAARLLPTFDTSKKDVLFVTEGNRWRKEVNNLTTSNRLHFFDDFFMPKMKAIKISYRDCKFNF